MLLYFICEINSSICYRKNATTLELFHLLISQHELYPADDELVDKLLELMATEPIEHVCEYLAFMQIKGILITYRYNYFNYNCFGWHTNSFIIIGACVAKNF